MDPVTSPYAVRFDVHYPEADLNRLTSFFRVFVAIPILIVLATVSGGSLAFGRNRGIAVAGGLLFAAPLLMIVFREKYPRWWFDWNLQLCASRTGWPRFSCSSGMSTPPPTTSSTCASTSTTPTYGATSIVGSHW